MSKIKPIQIQAKHLANLREVVGARHVIEVTAGPTLDPVILSLGRAPHYRREIPNRTSFAKQRSTDPNDFRIHFHAAGQWRVIDLAPTVENYHFIQPLGADEWLLVRGRAASEADRNAHVYGPDGRRRRSFALGDGIEDAQATRDSKIWVSFIDEGVFGGVPTGQTGLICVDQNGGRLHDFAAVAAAAGAIVDCYALNVADNRDTWVYYYMDFPLVRLTDGKLASVRRSLPVRGSHAFAIADGRILFAGSYKDRCSLFDVRLSNKARRLVPIDENGARIGRFAAFGRSHCLFLTTDDSLFVVEA